MKNNKVADRAAKLRELAGLSEKSQPSLRKAGLLGFRLDLACSNSRPLPARPRRSLRDG